MASVAPIHCSELLNAVNARCKKHKARMMVQGAAELIWESGAVLVVFWCRAVGHGLCGCKVGVAAVWCG